MDAALAVFTIINTGRIVWMWTLRAAIRRDMAALQGMQEEFETLKEARRARMGL